jgi:hypothetical protein
MKRLIRLHPRVCCQDFIAIGTKLRTLLYRPKGTGSKESLRARPARGVWGETLGSFPQAVFRLLADCLKNTDKRYKSLNRNKLLPFMSPRGTRVRGHRVIDGQFADLIRFP